LPTTVDWQCGNPEKRVIMGGFVGAIEGGGAACEALDMAIVSGNVSLYNAAEGQAIRPTPTIGGVGLIAAGEPVINGVPRDGHVALLLGESGSHLGQSALLYEVWQREDGEAPVVDLD